MQGPVINTQTRQHGIQTILQGLQHHPGASEQHKKASLLEGNIYHNATLPGRVSVCRAYQTNITALTDMLTATAHYPTDMSYADWTAVGKHPPAFWVWFAMATQPIREWSRLPSFL